MQLTIGHSLWDIKIEPRSSTSYILSINKFKEMFSHVMKTDLDISGFHVRFKEQSHYLALIRKKPSIPIWYRDCVRRNVRDHILPNQVYCNPLGTKDKLLKNRRLTCWSYWEFSVLDRIKVILTLLLPIISERKFDFSLTINNFMYFTC